MSKRFAILSLCAVLVMETVFPQGTVADFARIPEVFAHFERHRKESSDITFLQFLNLHYGDTDHLSAPEPDHQKLPFSKRTHRPITFLQSIPGDAGIEPPKVTQVLMTIGGVIYRAASVPFFSSSIWQPPKI